MILVSVSMLVVAASAADPAPDAGPVQRSEPRVVPPAVSSEAWAPTMVDLAGLRDGFPLGTRMRLRLELAGSPAIEQRWEVVGHTAEGCTIASTVHDAETGALLRDEGSGSSTWEELLGHGRFPAARTEIADDTVTVPAGTFQTRRYTVREDDGSVKVLHFAKGLPGPPVSLVVTLDGAVTSSMVLLERTPR